METEFINNIWKRAQPEASPATTQWEEELAFLYKSGISLESSLAYLYGQKPSLQEYTDWFYQNRKKEAEERLNTPDVLTAEDLDFWDKNGYLVLKSAISKEACVQTRGAIWNFLDKTPTNPDSWYTHHPEQKGLMVNFSDHPALESNRRSDRIKKAFEQLYGTDQIYKTIDKVSFNPPVMSHYSFMGSALHWDVSLRLPIPDKFQGLIYLSDCKENDGAFHCVPGFHKSIDHWMATVPPGVHPRDFALQTLQPIPVIGEAGDMVIWHQALPHCATPNHGKTPRMVQYLTYFPETLNEAKVWI